MVKELQITSDDLVQEIRALVLDTRRTMAQAVNRELVLMHWGIGDRIRKEMFGENRADYGERIVDDLSVVFAAEFGRGFSRRNLDNMIRFSELFPDVEKVHALSAQLMWIFCRTQPDVLRAARPRFIERRH